MKLYLICEMKNVTRAKKVDMKVIFPRERAPGQDSSLLANQQTP